MRSLDHQFNHWISNYHQSEFFACNQGKNGCEYYHVLSPILHHFKIISSYSEYPAVILKTISKIYLSVEKPNILVVGIDSEVSAKSLLQILDFFEEGYSLTFIDCCSTPLNRISACLESQEQFYIQTQLLDIFTPEAAAWFESFDVVFADSFLKQLNPEKKQDALGLMNRFLKNESSRLIIREYFGDLTLYLPALGAKIDDLFAENNAIAYGFKPERTSFFKIAEKVKAHYQYTGAPYKEAAHLKMDIDQNGLSVIEEYVNTKATDAIMVAGKAKK